MNTNSVFQEMPTDQIVCAKISCMLTGVITSVNKCCSVDIFIPLWDLNKGLKYILPIKNLQIQVSWVPLSGRTINLMSRSEHWLYVLHFVMHYIIVTIKLHLLLLTYWAVALIGDSDLSLARIMHIVCREQKKLFSRLLLHTSSE